MKIKYTKERLKVSLRMGWIFICIGIIFLLLSFINSDWKGIPLFAIGIGEIGAALFSFFIHYFQNKNQYLSIENGKLTKHTLFPKTTKLVDVKSIKEFAGDIKLISKNGEFIIDTQIIDPNSLVALKKELNELKLEKPLHI